jgi:type VI secretion system protein ImpA
MLGEERIAQVLAGIGEDEGVGVDGREDESDAGEIFRELRFQRKSVFRAEQKAAMGEDTSGEDNWSWEILLETALDYLSERGKDLEVMAIAVEGATRVDGVDGLRSALTLQADLIEKFWDAGLYPREDEDDGIEARFLPISGLSGGGSDKDGTLIGPIRRITLASERSGGELRYLDRVLANAQLAAAQNSSANRESLTAEAQGVLDEIDSTVRRLNGATLDLVTAKVSESENSWRRAVSYISERTKPRFPAASRVTDELRNVREWLQTLRKLLPDDAPGDEQIEEAEGEGGGEASAAGAAAGVRGGPFTIGKISSREDALRAVTAAADYFDKFEPLSPTGSALREINRRARLSFRDLLSELIPDSDTRDTFYWRSGIKPPAEQEESYE